MPYPRPGGIIGETIPVKTKYKSDGPIQRIVVGVVGLWYLLDHVLALKKKEEERKKEEKMEEDWVIEFWFIRVITHVSRTKSKWNQVLRKD